MLTRSNYQIYFLDYHEGNLTERHRSELFLFLEQHPDLKEEFDSFVNVVLEPDTLTSFANKESLKKKENIHSGNYRTWLVAYFEKDLNLSQIAEVERFLEANPSLKPELEIIRRTKISPDHRIVFKNKSVLRKGGKLIGFSSPAFRALAVAASILLLLVSIYVFRHQESNAPQMADKNVPSAVSPSENPSSSVSVDTIKDEKKTLQAEHKIVSPEVNHKSLFASDQKRKSNPEFEKKLQTVPENPAPESAIAQQSPQQKDSVVFEKQIMSEQEPKLAANTQVNSKRKTDAGKLSEFLSEQDMKDLGLISNTPVPEQKETFWTLATKGANRLSKATGKEISVEKTKDVVDDATTYALEVGKFSISHTEMK